MQLRNFRCFSPAAARDILYLAWPTILQVLMNTAVQYVDTAIVVTLGTYATAAISSTVSIGNLLNCSALSLATSFLIHVSRAYASGNIQETTKLINQSVLVVLFYGAFLTVLNLLLSPFFPAFIRTDPRSRELATQYYALAYAPMLFRIATVIFGNILWAVGDTKTPILTAVLVDIVHLSADFF